MPKSRIVPKDYTTATRARRRRECLSVACCCLLLAFTVIIVGLNLAQILASEIELQNTPKVTEAPRPPNYYEQLGVSPLISEQDLRVEWKRFGLEHHPDKKSLDALTLDETEEYLRKQKMFETLLQGRLRCEYDREHRIKGRWQATSCREAFREEYRELLREEAERVYEKQAAEGRIRKVKVEVEVEQEIEIEVEEQTPETEAEPQAKPIVPVITVELDPEPEIRTPSVDSIPGVKALKSGAAEVWNNGIVYNWIRLKALIADCSEKVYSFLASFSNIHLGVDHL